MKLKTKEIEELNPREMKNCHQITTWRDQTVGCYRYYMNSNSFVSLTGSWISSQRGNFSES